MSEKLLTLQEASKMLGTRPITLRKWDREGKLVAVRVGPRADRKYQESDITAFIERSNKTELEWQEYIRSGVSYHHFAEGFQAFAEGMEKYLGVKIKHLMAYLEHSTLFWYYERNDIYDVGKKIVDKLLESKIFQDKFFRLSDEKSKRTLSFLEHNKVANLSKDELAALYKKLSFLLYDGYCFSMAIDGTDESLMIDVSAHLKKILKKKLGDTYTEKEFINVYNVLTMPSKLSYLNDERKMMLELLKDTKSRKLNNAQAKKRAEIIVKKFWWTSLGWQRGKAKDETEILKEIDAIKNTDFEKELKEIEEYSKNTEDLKGSLDKKYSFHKDKPLTQLLQLIDKLFVYHDYRKEIQMKTAHYRYALIDEISKKTRVPTSLIESCSPKEVIELLKSGKINEDEINQRSSRFLLVMSNGKVTQFSGKLAEIEHNKQLGFRKEDIKDMQGTTACPGKVIAEAFVAITVDMALKIKEGQVLVTGMTTPDFVPAMKKASAIITDEGGITCHAAIVSRELHKPCIVGTKSATRTIRTGDLIEVAANHGVVRILKRSGQKDDDKK